MAGGFVEVPRTASDGGRALERYLAERFAAALKKNPERLQPLVLAPTGAAVVAEPDEAAAEST
jgi:hypothetical protein